MTVRALAVAFCSIMIGAALADDMAIKNQEKKSYKHRIPRQELELEYLLFLPQGYKEETSKKWPLMLFLHGAGERGTNIAKVTVHGPPKIVKDNADFPFIVVSPQCPTDQVWSDEALLGLLDKVTKEHRVDPARIYLTGLSMGGYGTWSLGLKHPERFAAIAPICGGGDILTILLAPKKNEAALKRLPVWVFHGAKDSIVPLSESERMVNALKRHGNQNVKLTVYPEADHDSWTETYKNQELYDWMLQQKSSYSGPSKVRKKKAASK